jgi:hypothetical protein
LGGPVRQSDQEKETIKNLIADGRKLNPMDLACFYRWMDTAHAALRFDPHQQQRFEKYCRSSSDSNSVRLYIGIWILKLTVQEASSCIEHLQNSFLSSERPPHFPRRSSSGPRRKR